MGRRPGTKVSESTRRRMSLAVGRTWRNPASRRRRLVAMRLAGKDPESSKRRSVAQRLFAKEHPERKQAGGRPFGTPQSEEAKERIGLGSKLAWEDKEKALARVKKVSVTNRRLYREGKLRIPGPNAWHRRVYRHIVMRSSWEAAFARWCDENTVAWVYEPLSFSIPSGSYTPDFYLLDYDFWIEIKGAMLSNPMRRFFEFKEKYPENRIALLDGDLLRELEILR
jgi:hypothetical protein